MTEYIPKSALVAEIEKRIKEREEEEKKGWAYSRVKIVECEHILSDINSLEVKEVDVWKTVDNINTPQADKNKIYCVFTKDRHILATVINHPKDEELLQWKCTEFPHHRYDMCEGDKYMQIV